MPSIYFEYAVYRPSVHRVDKLSGPLFGTKYSQIVPRVGAEANYFRWGQLEYLEQWQYFEILYALRGIVFRNCGYILACALGIRWCSYSHYSQYLGLLRTRNSLAASTPILSVLGLRFGVEHLSVKPLCFTLSTKEHLFWGIHIYCICCILLNRSQNIMAQPRLQVTFFVRTLTPHTLKQIGNKKKPTHRV